MWSKIALPFAIVGYLLFSYTAHPSWQEYCTSWWSSCMSRNKPLPNQANKRLQEWHQQEAEEEAFAEQIAQSDMAHCVAKVIFQANGPWSTTIWANVGSQSKLPFTLKKHCPVLDNNVVVGIVDFVGDHSCRIRLICDPLMRLATRVQRGSYKQRVLLKSIETIQQELKDQALLPRPELATALSKLLACIATQCSQEGVLLAKGELQGCENIQHCRLLSGVGFNYDSADEEGPSRDIRSGQSEESAEKIPLLAPGDILVTSGLDGYFPKNLLVGQVTQVFPLEEGAIAYRLQAKSLSHELACLEYVTIIPAIEHDAFGTTDDEYLATCIAEDL